MHAPASRFSTSLLVLAIVVAAFGRAADHAQAPAKSAAPGAGVIACRVLDAQTSRQLRLRIVIFHQRNDADRERLSELLRRHSETLVDIQTADGKWHTGTALRLKSCFGRGLLLFPEGAAHLVEKDDFTLKFPPD